MALSLFGGSPVDDYETLVKAERARRVNRWEPAQSLLLLKATATIQHGGGKELPPTPTSTARCWSEMYRGPYRTMADVENHMRAIDFALECGIDIIADTRVWSGEFDKVNALREGDDLHFGELALKLADYILLSALSCSPSQTFYLPTQGGIPAEDKREIKRWLDWGRANIDYLFVRKDLPHWPTPGKVDGSAHILGDRGLVFLFNPNASPASGEFALTAESIGLSGEGEFRIAQEHPVPGRTQTARAGETLRWEVPAQTDAVLRIQKVPPRK